MTYDILYKMYVEDGKSWAEIAKELNTYPNDVRRKAKKLGIKSRSKGEAQKIVLTKREHPTKGKKKSVATREKVSDALRKSWSKVSEDERKSRADGARKRFDARADKKEFWDKAGKAIRKTAKEGSRMEHLLVQYLTSKGYQVVFHGKTETNTNLEVDILLPKEGIAIEVDGPSHFMPIRGMEALQLVRIKDAEKNGLLLQSYRVIRLRYFKYTEGIKRRACQAVEDFIKCKTKFSEKEIT